VRIVPQVGVVRSMRAGILWKTGKTYGGGAEKVSADWRKTYHGGTETRRRHLACRITEIL
jgi:hypothetical protein